MRGKQCFCREKSWNGGRRKGGLFFFLKARALLLISGHKNLGHNCSLPACAQTGGGDSEKKGGNKGKGGREKAPGGKIHSDKFMHVAYWLFFYGFIYMPKGQKWLKKVRYSIDKRAFVWSIQTNKMNQTQNQCFDIIAANKYFKYRISWSETEGRTKIGVRIRNIFFRL